MSVDCNDERTRTGYWVFHLIWLNLETIPVLCKRYRLIWTSPVSDNGYQEFFINLEINRYWYLLIDSIRLSVENTWRQSDQVENYTTFEMHANYHKVLDLLNSFNGFELWSYPMFYWRFGRFILFQRWDIIVRWRHSKTAVSINLKYFSFWTCYRILMVRYFVKLKTGYSRA